MSYMYLDSCPQEQATPSSPRWGGHGTLASKLLVNFIHSSLRCPYSFFLSSEDTSLKWRFMTIQIFWMLPFGMIYIFLTGSSDFCGTIYAFLFVYRQKILILSFSLVLYISQLWSLNCLWHLLKPPFHGNMVWLTRDNRW